MSFFSNKIVLGWAHAKSGDHQNFGDELSPYIVAKLTGKEVVHMPVVKSRSYLFLILLKRILLLKVRSTEFKVLFSVFFGKEFVLALGSILQFYKINGGLVWGTGLISASESTGKHKYFAVRGPETYQLLSKNNNVPQVFGDPALVLKKLYDKPVDQNCTFAAIPHILHYVDTKNDLKNREKELKVINLNTNKVEAVIDEVRSCKYVLSSSLHGIIVAHAFGVPALWVNMGTEKLLGDNIKFKDYFRSVGIEPYKALEMKEILRLSDLEKLFIEQYAKFTLPTIVIEELSSNLIKSSPFEVLNKYK